MSMRWRAQNATVADHRLDHTTDSGNTHHVRNCKAADTDAQDHPPPFLTSLQRIAAIKGPRSDIPDAKPPEGGSPINPISLPQQIYVDRYRITKPPVLNNDKAKMIMLSGTVDNKISCAIIVMGSRFGGFAPVFASCTFAWTAMLASRI